MRSSSPAPTPRLYRQRRDVRGASLALLLLAALIAGGAWFYHAIYVPVQSFTSLVAPTPTRVAAPTASAAAVGSTGQGGPAAASMAPTAVPPAPPTPLPSLGGTQRINVLLLGSDTDAKFQGSGIITQIMLVATIDPVHRTIGLLSIPRDLWVPIPGHPIGKIQIAYQYGEHDHPGGGGVALARQTVEDDLGIHIDHVAWVGLEGFIKVIDTAGGVDMDVLHPILDDEYPDDLNGGKVSTVDIYASRRLYIPAGPQHLDGITALEYVRSRHADKIGDFGRSQRQQQVLLKVRQKIEQPGTILRIPEYLSDLNGYVRSDFSLQELLAYGNFMRQNSAQPVTQVVLMPPNFSQIGTSNDGLQQSIVIPNWQAVHAEVAHMFAQPLTVPPPVDPAAGDARIGVENGTTIGGLGTRAAAYLRGLGYTVDPARNAIRTDEAVTTVTVYNPQKQALAELIAEPLGAVVRSAPSGSGPDDIVVTVGAAHGTFEGI